MLLLLRFIGVWFLLIAMVAAVVDATKSLAGGGTWVVTPMGEQWRAINTQSLDAVKAWIVGHAGRALCACSFAWAAMAWSVGERQAMSEWLQHEEVAGDAFLQADKDGDVRDGSGVPRLDGAAGCGAGGDH